MAEEQAPKPIDVARQQLRDMRPQFEMVLPKSISPEKFERVVLTALQNNPKLLQCTPSSVWNACMRAAQDGLLPDGRDGAIVPYAEDAEGKKSNKNAQWMPMIAGIRKLARNSGKLKDWYVEAVYAGDNFHYQKGDDPRLHHVPVPPSLRVKDAPHQGIIAVYSIAVLEDGYKTAPEVMWIEEIEAIKGKSKAQKKGPWGDPAFYSEMCKKTVARRHSKTLPMSSDLDELIRREDETYDLEPPKDLLPKGDHPKTLSGRLDALAGPQEGEGQPGDDEGTPPAEGAHEGGEGGETGPPGLKGVNLDDPEAVLEALDKALAAAKTDEERENEWVSWQPTVAGMFPPDIEAATAILNKHRYKKAAAK